MPENSDGKSSHRSRLFRFHRECPEMSCDVVFELSEWDPICIIIHLKQLPKSVPTVIEMIKMVASLRGYVI